ncbi:unnamed protein product, partial [Sphagnum balticum]
MNTPAELKIAATTIAVVIFLHYIIKQWLYRRTKLKRAPGPFPIWPVLGSLLLLGRLPHRAFYQLSKKYGDIMELKLGSVRTIVVSSPELAKEVLKVHDLIFASRPDIAAPKIIFNDRDIAFAPYEDRWRHLKKVIMLGLLSAKKLEASTHVRDEELSSLVHQIFEDCKDGKPVNMQRSLFSTSMNVVTRLLFRKRYFSTEHTNEDCEEFKDLIVKIMTLCGTFNISDYVPYLKPFDVQGLVPQFNQTRLRFDRLFDRIIQVHLKEKKRPDESKDFLDVMLSLPGVDGVSDRIDDSTIRAVVSDILVAGTDTIITTVEWGLVQLLKHPGIIKKAQDELNEVVGHERVVDERDIPQLKYFQAVVKETLRLHPAGPLLLPHESREACEVGGYHVPTKTRIFVNVWAVHRHPSAYENPLDFNPERFLGSALDTKGMDFQLLPFGSGRRICPGMNFGLLMVQIILAKLLHTFTWMLPGEESPEDIDMGEVFGVTIPKAIPLQVV